MEQNETGCQAPPEGPLLCANNCGFFGSAATMNLCSKCHKDLILEQEQAQLAAASIGSIVNGCSSNSENEAVVAMDLQITVIPEQALPLNTAAPKEMVKGGPSRCSTCRKRVGLTGFNCRCGDLFCSVHRYSDKHECPYNYRTAGQDAIAKANPVVKADKLDKI